MKTKLVKTISLVLALTLLFSACGKTENSQVEREDIFSSGVKHKEIENGFYGFDENGDFINPDYLYSVEKLTSSLASGESRSTKTYEFINGDKAYVHSVNMQGLSVNTLWKSVEKINLSQNGSIHIYEPSKGWTILSELKEGVYDTSLVVFDAKDGSESYLVYVPTNWEKIDESNRKFCSYGQMKIAKKGSKYSLEFFAKDISGQISDYTVIHTQGQAIDWTVGMCELLWGTYANVTGEGRWCSDGYYFLSPENYKPAGKNVYYWMVDAYLLNSMTHLFQFNRVAQDFALIMIETISQRQNEYGYIPTDAEVSWLVSDYQIGRNFYDTRFNTGFMSYTLKSYLTLKDPSLFDILAKYKDFYISFANTNHINTKRGYLVEDYVNPNGGSPCHASLNHNLAEALLCYQLYDLFGDPQILATGNLILAGVEDTAPNWIKQNKDFHYALYQDGKYKTEDYEYLTYNDLLELQKYFVRHGFTRNTALDTLMDAKHAWMDANGISGYETDAQVDDRTYAAVETPNKQGDVPILMYHHFTYDEKETSSVTVLADKIENDLAWLKEHRYKTLLPSDLIQIADMVSDDNHMEGALPRRWTMITVDDGYTSNYEILFPLLKKYGLRAEINIITSLIDETERTNFLSWDMCNEMEQSKIVEFGSHTYNLHNPDNGGNYKNGEPNGVQRLSKESDEAFATRVLDDLKQSYRSIYNNLNRTTPQCAFAYPYGAHDKYSDSTVKELFQVSFSVEPENWKVKKDLSFIPRHGITPQTNLSDVLNK